MIDSQSPLADGQGRVVLCGLNARYRHTSLAVRSLAAMIRTHWPRGPVVKICEWSINDQELALLDRLNRENAAVYAFSCAIWNITLVRRLCRSLKKIRPQAWIVWGGPEIGDQPGKRLAGEPGVDLLIRGEGEQSFMQLLRNLPDIDAADHSSLAAVPGLVWRDPVRACVRENDAGPLLTADAWPFPYDQADLATDCDRILYYESSRGCPYHCSYCLSALDKTVRSRSLPLVFAELEQLIAADVRQVKFVDRTFNCLPERARLIWRFLIERRQRQPFRTNFHFEVAGDLLDDETTNLLITAPAGLIQLEIGVQTIQPDVLLAINRVSRLDILQKQVERLRLAGNIHLHLDLIAGLPSETLVGFGRSFDWVYRLKADHLQLGFLKILPGAPISKQAVERHYLWQDDPPYEVFRSDGMDFTDLCQLKQIETLLDSYANSGLFPHALDWLSGRWERPFVFYQDLAAWYEAEGGFDRAIGRDERCRLLWRFGLAAVPALRQDAWLAGAWLDLLRSDYLLSGQKDVPVWLGFWESREDPAEKEYRRRLNRLVKQKIAPDRRFRLDRLTFDWAHYRQCGELIAGDWLAIYDLSECLPVLFDCRPLTDLL